MAAAVIYAVGLWKAYIPFFVLCRLSAVTGLWLMLPGKKLPAARNFMKHSFFLYAIHFAIVRLVNKGAATFLPEAVQVWYVPFGLFLIMPIPVILISTAAGGFMRRFLPDLWKLLTGGR